MKIAFIVTFFPKLSQTFVLNQITGLLDLGHEVDIYANARGTDSKVHPDVARYDLLSRTYYQQGMPRNKLWRLLKGIALVATNFYRDPLAILQTLNPLKYGKEALSLRLLYAYIHFKRGNYDVIQCHFGSSGILGARLKAWGVRGKLVAMFHGRDIRHGLEAGGHIYHQLFEEGDCLLAVSDYNYENLVRFGADPDKIVFHPVGIDVSAFPYRPPSANTQEGPIVVLTVARLVEEKGLRYGIHAIARLLQENSNLDLEYRIVGAGPLEEELKGLTKALDLAQVVRFLGSMRRPGVIREMGQAHLFLLPSLAEALPVVLMEAQAVGLPVLATRVGSTHQAIDEGASGLLVPSGDVDALANKLAYLIDHPERWPEMGRAGRAFVEEHYDIRNLNRRLVAIYKELLETESGGNYRQAHS